MFYRTLTHILHRFSKLYPLIGITGPRQSGKSTLSKTVFANKPYISFENLDIRTKALADPRAFLNSYENTGAIFDEIQKAPILMSYLQEIADNTKEKGKYILTGSENFVLSESITQSLSGRIGMTTLLPLSMSEISEEQLFNPYEHIFYGGYPGLYQNNMTTNDFYPPYIQTYLERDVRQFKNIENLYTFQNFLKLCAGRIGQLVNLSSLAQDCGISQPTARAWLSILEASYIIFFLSPFYKNYSKRLIKMPKLYFYDTGLACSLLSLEKVQQVDTHYLKGALYENLIILELLKGRLNRGLPANLYFWRDHTGHEIDCIAEWGGKINAIEIKMNQTFSLDQIQGINFMKTIASEINGYLIYNGKEDGKVQDITLLPVQDLEKIFI